MNGKRFKQALATFANCLREHGVKIPPPDPSGKGTIVTLKGVDTKSPQFKAADMKCLPILRSAFKRSSATGAGSGSGSTGAP